MKSRLPKFAVWQYGSADAIGREYAVGDGITAPSRLLIGTYDSHAEAQAAMQDFDAAASSRLGAMMPGDGKMMPLLDCGAYDPLDFVGAQHRDEESYGKRFAALCGRLMAEIEPRRHRLIGVAK